MPLAVIGCHAENTLLVDVVRQSELVLIMAACRCISLSANRSAWPWLERFVSPRKLVVEIVNAAVTDTITMSVVNSTAMYRKACRRGLRRNRMRIWGERELFI